MARWYLWINAWREQDCVLCEGTFRYRVRRRVYGEGRDNARAEYHARRKLTWQWKELLAMRPCPYCGCIQPDVISQARNRLYPWVGLTELVLFYLLISCSPGSPRLTVTIGAALAPLFWAAHFAILFWRPNRRLDANLEKARSLEEAGELEAVEPPSGERNQATAWLLHGTGWLQYLALGTSLLMIAVVAAAAFVPLALGWPPPDDTPDAPVEAALHFRLCLVGHVGLAAFLLSLLFLWWRANHYWDLAHPGRLRPLDEAPLEGEPAPPPADAIRQPPKRPGKSRKIRRRMTTDGASRRRPSPHQTEDDG
jgi:hypothetical protein